LQEKELRDDRIRDRVVHLRAQKDDAVFQKAAVNVHRSLFATVLFDDVRD
jgi:hypothetical protein